MEVEKENQDGLQHNEKVEAVEKTGNEKSPKKR